ncbi:MAG: DUF6898 family protein [Brevundimonas sp.]
MSPGGPPRPETPLGEVIIEKVRNGAFLKVSAIHVATGLEVSAVGPVHEPHGVERVALAKLSRALQRAKPQ